MEHNGKTVAALIGFMVLVFAMPLVGVVLGAFAGWVVGLVFPETFREVMAAMGIEPVAVWKLGTFMGFVGGFFTTRAGSKHA